MENIKIVLSRSIDVFFAAFAVAGIMGIKILYQSKIRLT